MDTATTKRDEIQAIIDELTDEMEEIDERRAAIKGQIEQAQSRVFIAGEYSDPDWFRRAKGALRHLGVERNRLNREIADHKRRLRAANIEVNKDAFYVAVREVVDDATWDLIVMRHTQLRDGV